MVAALMLVVGGDHSLCVGVAGKVIKLRSNLAAGLGGLRGAPSRYERLPTGGVV